MKKIFFSVITCTRNSGKFILRNIESVDKQTFKDYEQIFIDGESNDETKKIIKKFVKKDPRKYKLCSFPANGVSDAFNQGIKKSNGKYLIFLNSDDYFYDKKVLQDSYDYLISHKDADWIYGKINVVEEDERMVGVFPLRKIFQIASPHLIKFVNYVPHQAVFMKKEVFKKYGDFDISLKINMDTDLWLRIAPKTNWKFFDRIVSNYRLRSDSLSSSVKNKALGTATLEKVQKRYLSKKELFFAKITNRFVGAINRTYR
jgi:glycosyltransferase involved in cell wall biosynthesis